VVLTSLYTIYVFALTMVYPAARRAAAEARTLPRCKILGASCSS